ncbi:signal recognition particle-docking protein FtsY [Corynebacterium incognita]|uniref:Signal recognition particle receptor FtsY n=1 Tax=Corynebacterium incognita TaxID=2754725 RepID=A0A7G7CQE0_9CORY|nr:signal recognition particle-docking protein FtsY [Corynebacterium incognita]QNE89806.1 signal recognition particle-docking protein FtsY [Corynebacterium incognita]
MTGNLALWIIIGVAVLLLLMVIALVVIGKKRADAKKVSFEKKDEPKELTREEKSGNYQAKGGFNFAPAGSSPAEKEKEAVPATPQADSTKATSTKATSTQATSTKASTLKDGTNNSQVAAAKSSDSTSSAAKAVAPKAGPTPEAKPQDSAPTKAEEKSSQAKASEAKAAAPKADEKTVDAGDKKPSGKAGDKGTDKERLGATSAAVAGGVGGAAIAGATAASGKKEQTEKADAEKKGDAKPHAGVDKQDAAGTQDKNQAQHAPEVAAQPKDAKVEERKEDKAQATEAKSDEPKTETSKAEQTKNEEAKAEEAAVAAGVTAASAAAARDEAKPAASAEAAATDSAVKDSVIADGGQQTEEIAPAAGRIGRLRGRLSRSQNAIGKGLLGILSEGDLDEDAWEDVEDTLIMADLGTKSTLKVTEALRERIAERGVANEAEARAMLREVLIEAGKPEMDRSIKAMPNNGKPAVVMVVGVNGTGKTTTTGKLARVLVSMGHNVLLGAADTFRAAAADQLETWGRRVGASTVRGKEGADPAAVAFDAVAAGVEQGVDVVLIDTAGRLHTSVGLMDQLGKVKRVVEKKTDVDEVLLVVDATVGQNGLMQARKFRDIVDITGLVLTKLDGTAKGGIVFQVQEELGVPVKLVGLGEGADDLAPFEIEGFVDALLGPASQ